MFPNDNVNHVWVFVTMGGPVFAGSQTNGSPPFWRSSKHPAERLRRLLGTPQPEPLAWLWPKLAANLLP